MRQSGEYHSLAFRHGRAAVRTELEVQDDETRARRRRVSSRWAQFEVLGRNREGTEIAAGKSEEFLMGESEGVTAKSEVFGKSEGRADSVVGGFGDSLAGGGDDPDDTLDNTLSATLGPGALMSDIRDEAGRRNVLRTSEARTGEGPDVLSGKGSGVEMVDDVTVVGDARVGGERPM